MTEETIIDGVNVSGCCCYEKGKCLWTKRYYESDVAPDCENIKDCHYKQLKRLEQERNELQGRLLTLADTYQETRDTCKRLEQENKELKDKITALEDKLQLRMASDKESDEFWDEIFSAEDYPFNKENAYKELKDYYFVLEQIPKIYMEITGGTLSKTTYFASSVIQAYNDALERYYDKIDDLEYNNNAYRSALEEIRRTVIDIIEDNGRHNLSDFSSPIRIEKIINEVLE